MTSPLDPPSSDSEPMASRSFRAILNRSYFGPLLLLSVALLSVVLVGASSPQYGLGFTAGKTVTSLALALPIYLIVRYFTSVGYRLSRRGQLNVLCLLTVIVWGLQLALSAALPGFIAGQTANGGVAPRSQPDRAKESSVPRLPDGSVDWSQFTPIERPSSDAKLGAQSARPDTTAGPPPTYETKGWTQESTGSTEAGPWLNYAPPGTRYYRDANRVIYQLYPPGVRPQAEPANPFGLGDSSANVPR